MIHEPQYFSVIDPRTMAGDPYEVAGRSVRQIQGMLELTATMRDATERMLRNAHMERELSLRGKPDADGWEESAQKRALDAVFDELSAQVGRLELLEKAAAFDPKQG